MEEEAEAVREWREARRVSTDEVPPDEVVERVVQDSHAPACDLTLVVEPVPRDEVAFTRCGPADNVAGGVGQLDSEEQIGKGDRSGDVGPDVVALDQVVVTAGDPNADVGLDEEVPIARGRSADEVARAADRDPCTASIDRDRSRDIGSH